MIALPERFKIEAERARRSFRLFVELAWPQIEPGVPFVAGYHVDAICAALEAFARGEISLLAINLPPRHSKSTITAIAWIAWMWTHHPEIRWLACSYAEQLALRDGGRCRRLLESSWYQQRWGDEVRLRPDQNAKHRFENDRGGVRIATSVGAGATGQGGDILLGDDLHKLEDAHSAAARRATIDWYQGTLATRLNDPRAGGIVLVGQRIHEDDIFGHVLHEGGWTHLCLPAEFEPNHPFRWPDDPRTRAGELLWPDRFGPDEIAKLKRRLGSYAAASQLQQRPAPAGGGIFQANWWNWYQPSERPQRFDRLIQSWDPAFEDTNDFVVGQVWGALGPDRYLLRQIRARLTFGQTLRAIPTLSDWVHREFPNHPYGHAILIERAANGHAVIDVLKRKLPGVIAIDPTDSKVSRAHAVSPQIEAGNVWLLGMRSTDNNTFDPTRTRQWVQAFFYEATTFPFGAHDDQVDCLTQALIYLSRPSPRVRALYDPR